jgi:chromosome segregation ATPase
MQANKEENRAQLDDLNTRETELEAMKRNCENMKAVNDGVREDKKQLKKDIETTKAVNDDMEQKNKNLKDELQRKKKLLVEKDIAIDDLNEIVGLVHDMNEFERKCKATVDDLRKVELIIQKVDTDMNKFEQKHNHNKDKSDPELEKDRKKALDDKIDKVNKDCVE